MFNKFRIALIAAALVMLPMSAAIPAALSDCSGTVVTGGTNVVAAPALPFVSFVLIENPSATASGVAAESLWVNLGAPATTSITAGNGSIEVTNATMFRLIGNTDGSVIINSININAATSGHKYICKRG